MAKGRDVISAEAGEFPSTSTTLIQGLKAREAGAWHKLAHVYGPLVYGWCRRQHVVADDAPDIVQDVFRTVLNTIDNFERDPNGSFRGWLSKITTTRIVDYWRRRQKHPQALGGSDFQGFLAQIPLADGESCDHPSDSPHVLHRVLELVRAEFETHTWQAFWRVTVLEQAPGDVADDLGISVNSVYVAKSKILRRLREELAKLNF